ncbi:MAG: hypothetical protein ACFFDB_00555 [Promethearchaeota archaeon]
MDNTSSQNCQFYIPKRLTFKNIYEISGIPICKCRESYYFQKKCPFFLGGTFCNNFKPKKGKMAKYWKKYNKIIQSKKYIRYKIVREIAEIVNIIK